MKPPFSCVLFDLDGTIADSAPGITATLALMFEELGMPIPPPADLVKYVGPPILLAFEEFAGLTGTAADKALEIYRAHYLDTGTLNSSIYEGVPDVLSAIHHSPLALSLATSKPELPATAMLDHANLTRYFDVITGASADETRSAKADVVAEAMRRLESIGADISRPVMIGDRIFDVEGAAAHGIPTIFVEWGYGSPAEQSGATSVVQTPEELIPLLLPHADPNELAKSQTAVAEAS